LIIEAALEECFIIVLRIPLHDLRHRKSSLHAEGKDTTGDIGVAGY
jgi:hypothetical protein